MPTRSDDLKKIPEFPGMSFKQSFLEINSAVMSYSPVEIHRDPVGMLEKILWGNINLSMN